MTELELTSGADALVFFTDGQGVSLRCQALTRKRKPCRLTGQVIMPNGRILCGSHGSKAGRHFYIDKPSTFWAAAAGTLGPQRERVRAWFLARHGLLAPRSRARTADELARTLRRLPQKYPRETQT